MMRRALTIPLLAAGLALAPAARANILPGQNAPAFTKTQLDAGPRSLSEFAGKVVVLFLFGYNCPVCLGDCPGFEQDVWQYYQSTRPGEVQVLGADVWNGTVAGVRDFRDQTGATFPLLLNGAAATGGDLSALYGPWDNYIVINRQGIVRYHSANVYPHGNRYHLNEIRATVDSLLAPTTDAPPAGAPAALRLSASPNPARGVTTLRLAGPAALADARVDVLDLQGRRVVSLARAAADGDGARYHWDGRDASGARAAPGLYLARATTAEHVVHQRLVRLP